MEVKQLENNQEMFRKLSLETDQNRCLESANQKASICLGHQKSIQY